MQSNHFRFFINFRNGILGIAVAIAVLGCNTPLQSQKYFAQAVKDDPIMEPLHQTALYTVYFDHALQRCVMHSSYTWGESGGGTGGTGLGVNVFNCNPQALKAHADRLRAQIENGTDYFELPVPKVRRTKPTSDKQRGGIQKRIKMTPTAQSPGLSQGASKLPVRPAPSVNTTQSGAADAQPASSAATAQPAPSPAKANQPEPPRPAKPAERQPTQKPSKKTGSKLLQPVTMP